MIGQGGQSEVDPIVARTHTHCGAITSVIGVNDHGH